LQSLHSAEQNEKLTNMLEQTGLERTSARKWLFITIPLAKTAETKSSGNYSQTLVANVVEIKDCGITGS